MTAPVSRLAWLQLWATLLLALSVASLAYFSLESHSALCAFRDDLQARHERLVTILEENPGPFPAAEIGLPDVPRNVLEQTVLSQASTLESLEGLEWPLGCW